MPPRGVTQLALYENGCSTLLLCARQPTTRISLNITAKLEARDSLSLTVGNESVVHVHQNFDSTRPVPRSITYPSDSGALGHNLVAQLQLEVRSSPSSSASHVAIRYDCTPAGMELSTADFEIALASRFAFPLFMFWLVARLVLRRRRARLRRRVPSDPPYETLREDASVVVATLALLPLVPYREVRLGSCGSNSTTNAEESKCAATADAVSGSSGSDDAARLGSHSPPDADSIAQECGICLERFTDDRVLRVLPCRHFFCAECVDRWFETRGLSGQVATRGLPCPLCKADASEDRLEK